MESTSQEIPDVRVKVEDLVPIFQSLATSLKAWRLTRSEELSSRIGSLIVQFDDTLFRRQHRFEDFLTKSWRFTLHADQEKTVCKELVLLVMRSVFSIVEQWGWQDIFGHQGGELNLPLGQKNDCVLKDIADITEAVEELGRIVSTRPDMAKHHEATSDGANEQVTSTSDKATKLASYLITAQLERRKKPTRDDLASEMHVDRKTISRWMNNEEYSATFQTARTVWKNWHVFHMGKHAEKSPSRNGRVSPGSRAVTRSSHIDEDNDSEDNRD